jgi:hypothetical protein
MHHLKVVFAFSIVIYGKMSIFTSRGRVRLEVMLPVDSGCSDYGFSICVPLKLSVYFVPFDIISAFLLTKAAE